MPILLFYVTHSDETVARNIVKQLLDQKLVACANVFPINSFYPWQGAVQNDNEWVTIFKTRPELEGKVEEALAAMHPYDTPCFMRWEVRANEKYEQWINEQVAVSG